MKIVLNDKIYDVIKWIVLVVLPSISVLVVALQKAWGWNIPIEAIVTTFSAIEVFLGSILGISCYNYSKTESESEETK